MSIPKIISPPGGVWQDDSPTHKAGSAIMAYTHPNIYKHFIRVNTVAFASSIIVILLLTTRLSSIHLLATVAVMHIMWVSMASIAVSYGASIMAISPSTETQSIAHVIAGVVSTTAIIIGLFWLRNCYFVLRTSAKNIPAKLRLFHESSVFREAVGSEGVDFPKF